MESSVPDTTVVLDALKILTTPATQTVDVKNEKFGTFDLLLKSNVEKFIEEIRKEKFGKLWCCFDENVLQKDITTGIELRWHFVCHILKLLEILCKSIKHEMAIFQEEQKKNKELKPSQAPPLSPDTLSIGHQKTAVTAVQFIIVLGITPYLEEGVGLPASKRSEFGEIIHLQNDDENLDNIEKSFRMIRCIRVLLKCCKIESLGTLILSRHLGDILGALLQLIHGQKMREKKTENTEDTHKRSPEDENKEVKLSTGEYNIPSEKWTPANIVDMVSCHHGDANTEPKSQIESNQPSRSSQNNTSSCTENNDNVSSNSHKKVQISTSEKTIDFDFCEESLNDLLEKISQPLLVRELMVLQGGPGKQSVQKGDGVNKQIKPVLVKAPAWLRKICGQLLSGIVMKPQGVIHVLHGMLGNAVADASGNLIADWRRFDAVAKVIASCPRMCSSQEEYYKLVSPQILSLLHQPNKQIARHFLRVACSTIINMSTNCPNLTQRYLITPLLNPLLLSTQDNEYGIGETQQIIVEEESLSVCIEDIHKVFVAGTEPNSSLTSYLVPILHPLFELFCFSKQGVSHLRSAVQEILVTSMKQYPKDRSLLYLQYLVLDNCETPVDGWKYLHPNVMFAPGSEGGTVVVTKPKEGYSMSVSQKTEGMIDLLKDLQRHGLTGDFFLFMMKELSMIIKAESERPDIQLPTKENVIDVPEDQTEKKINILNLLASLCEHIGPSCLKDTKQTLHFVEVTLERAVHILKASDDETTMVFENETLTMAMGLLTSVLTGGLKCSEADRNHMKKMLPLLQSLADNHHDKEVQEMASDLRVAIATHGVIWSERLSKSEKKNEETKDKEKPKTKSKPLIEVIDSLKDSDQQSDGLYKGKQEIENPMSSFEEALNELCDPLLPVRGHALISLCRLIESKDKETLEKQKVVLKIFEENLNHSDPYLYLTSARGLSLMANNFSDTIIPKLALEFAKFDKSDRSAELRMKIGECLVQTTKKLGDMAPKYRDVLLPAVLTGTRDNDALVRASSLSNLGEICRALKFSLGNIINEIFNCCQSLLKTDESPEVRKAAALLTTSLLQGLGQDVLKVLDSVLRDLYHLLKLTLKTEKDDKVKEHVILSLNELDIIMKDYLFPKQSLQKKIRVLDQT